VFCTSEDNNQHELTHSNERAQLQQGSSRKKWDTESHNEGQGKGYQTESKVDTNHTEHDSCSPEDNILCNNE